MILQERHVQQLHYSFERTVMRYTANQSLLNMEMQKRESSQHQAGDCNDMVDWYMSKYLTVVISIFVFFHSLTNQGYNNKQIQPHDQVFFIHLQIRVFA